MFSTTNTDQHLAEIARLIAPQGCFALIDDPVSLDVSPFKVKSVSTHWEFMFTRSMFGTVNVAAQGALLNEVSGLVDAGTLKTTLAGAIASIGNPLCSSNSFAARAAAPRSLWPVSFRFPRERAA